LYRLVPKRYVCQSLKRCHRPLASRLVPTRIAVFGSKIGSRGRSSRLGAIDKNASRGFNVVAFLAQGDVSGKSRKSLMENQSGKGVTARSHSGGKPVHQPDDGRECSLPKFQWLSGV